MTVSITSTETLHSISPQQWNKLAGADFPFAQYEFLVALENHDAVGKDFGWLPHYFLAHIDEELVGAIPAYVKYNSYGEFVFDWAWADAYQRNQLSYYPKLVSSIPYTPATGPRILVSSNSQYQDIANALIDGIVEYCQGSGMSSFHCLFTNSKDTEYFKLHPDFMLRLGCQFHWHNDKYQDFDHFLSFLTSKKRKQIKRERRIVKQQDIRFEILTGHTATDEHWEIYHKLYRNTFDRKSGIATLSESFFREIAKTMPENIVLVMAKHEGQYVASAFNLRGKDTLYGRHWGCFESFDNLHFETCYYQGLDYCIEHGLSSFEPGAQGEHKIARGFMPTETWSAHWIAEPQFKQAINQFLAHETDGMHYYINELNGHSPYKTNIK